MAGCLFDAPIGAVAASLVSKEELTMSIQISLAPLVALIAGILILIAPRLLNFIVALYLIIIGLIGLFGGNFHFR
jgi:uncharacterized protein YqgC (DUF456 family)